MNRQKEPVKTACSGLQQEIGDCHRIESRFGVITEINPDSSDIRVAYDGNPLPVDVSAKLGRAFTLAELQLAKQNQLQCRIDFINGDLALPVVTDIFFSILQSGEELVLKAKRIRIEAEEELVVGSPEAKTRYSGRDKRVTTEAKYVTSQAERANIVRGANILLN